MTKSRWIASLVAALLVGGTAAAFAIAWRPAIAPIDPPAPKSFEAALVKHGRELAAIGNCGACHTLRGGRNFAGGLPVPTPFGIIYSSNITPDPDTGIGRWPESAFRRAMRDGVARDGAHLYPTFPYDHFTNVSDDDDRALYAYLMTRAPVPWTEAALFAYLRHGWQSDHGVARGPMAEVVSNLAQASDGDIHAIAAYMAGVFGAPTPDRQRRGEELLAQVKSMPMPVSPSGDVGAAIYTAACADCHETGRPLPYGGVNLALSTALASPDPRNAANIVLSGVRPVQGERSPIMPGFAASMDDAQIAALLNYLRARFGNRPAWTGVKPAVADARRNQTVFLRTSPEPDNAPADVQREKP